MDIFCEKHIPELVDVITSSCPDKSANTSEGAAGRIITKPEVLLNICELLCFCVMQDLSRTRYSYLMLIHFFCFVLCWNTLDTICWAISSCVQMQFSPKQRD